MRWNVKCMQDVCGICRIVQVEKNTQTYMFIRVEVEKSKYSSIRVYFFDFLNLYTHKNVCLRFFNLYIPVHCTYIMYTRVCVCGESHSSMWWSGFFVAASFYHHGLRRYIETQECFCWKVTRAQEVFFISFMCWFSGRFCESCFILGGLLPAALWAASLSLGRRGSSFVPQQLVLSHLYEVCFHPTNHKSHLQVVSQKRCLQVYMCFP